MKNSIFEYFSLALESNFTVEIDNIQAENHCNSPKKCIFSQKLDDFDSLYSILWIPILEKWKYSGEIPSPNGF